ncbi:cytochrome P450 4C1 [Amyelois transitella]|uniref:cytochrome P450 4C1 n=1 Tax=Amyelois transitella TaxID=680683 RepID=UPI00298F768E|nr:cytochrome P450 4C1 [Amyelois transitella]XP_013184023.2 cytochrome P450 4C1 [Amyelois transitella]
MIWLVLAFLGSVASFWLRWRYKNRKLLAMAKKIPGPPTLPWLGNAVMFMCDGETQVVIIKDLIRLYGDFLRFWLGPDLCVILTDPDDLKALLTNSKISIKGPQYKYMYEVLGGGILSGSGPTWRKHRKIATPNYGKRAIEGYEITFNKEVDILMKKFRSCPGRTFDVYPYIVQCTSYSVCQTLMGLTKEQTMCLPYLQSIIDKSPRMYDIVYGRMTKWYFQIDPVFWLSGNNKELQDFIHMLTEFSKVIVKHRREKLKTAGHTEQLMNSEEDESINTTLSVIDRFILSQELNDYELFKETFTIFTSSQEASAKIASYVILMMAYHPDCQEKLYKEIKQVIGDADRPVTGEDLKNMPYLEMVFKETIRLFPIGALLQRTVAQDTVIKSGVLPGGCSLVVPIYHLHRDPRYWENPEDFDPERFNPENTKLRHPNCYLPFSLGPMDCLGRYFGTKLIKTICTRVLREFEVSSPQTYQDLKVAICISVVSLNGYPVIFKKRQMV